MSEHTPGPDSSALLRRLGFDAGATPSGVEEQCTLTRAALGADCVELTLVGASQPQVRVGESVSGGVASAVDVRTPSGQVFATLTAHASGPVDQVLLEAAGGMVAALAELEEARTRLFDLEEAVARSDDELSRASGQIVHDLNNPLAAISMCLEIARDEVPEGELLASLLDRAAGSAAKLKRLVVALDDYGQPAEPGTSDLAVEVPALLAEFAPLLDETVHVVTDLPTVALASGEVRTLFGALWENATKFRRDDVDLEVEVGAERMGEMWRLWVRDNGRGIDEADAERVFAPTVRLDKRVPGLGLGLAAVRRIVTRAGGRVGVEAAPTEGTTVWFTLPAAEATDR